MVWITTLFKKYLKPGLDITSISTLYKTTMTQAYTRIRILGDETVNSALQGKKIGSTKIPSQTMQKKSFNKPH